MPLRLIYAVPMELAGVFGTVVSIALAIYWLVAIFQVADLPAWQYWLAGSDKAAWVCIVVCLPILGALVWHFWKRADVLDAEDRFEDALPPDWYMDPESGARRWWDGSEWTDRYNTWSGARPKRTHRAV